jgi:hypothetical protein
MKKLLISTLLVFSCIIYCGQSFCNEAISQKFPIPGSLGNVKLQKDTFMPVWVATKSLNSSCADISVVNATVIQQPQNIVKKNGVYTSGNWMELWTVNYCGQTKKYPITFSLDKTGASYSFSPN